MIASVAQIGVQPAPAKLSSVATSPTTFSQLMEQHQTSIHGMPDNAIGQNLSESKDPLAGPSNATNSPAGVTMDRPSASKTDKKATDSQGDANQDGPDNTSSAVLLPQIAVLIPAPPAAPPAAPAQSKDASTTSSTSTSTVAESSAKPATTASARTLPNSHFLNALREDLNAKTAEALPPPETKARLDEGKEEALPKDTNSLAAVSANTQDDDGTKTRPADTSTPNPDPNSLRVTAKAASTAKQLPEDAGASQPKLSSPVDGSQHTKGGNGPQLNPSKPAKENDGVGSPQNKIQSAQAGPSANKPVDVPAVLATTDSISTAKAAQIKELKLPVAAPQPASDPKQVSPTFNAQATPQAPAPKEANATHAGKVEKRDDDSGEAIQETQPVATDAPKDLSATQPHASFPHVVAQTTNIKDHVPPPASKDLSPGTLAGLHAADTPAPEAASAAALLHSKILQRTGQSELRVGIQAGEFGTVDIRTSMSRNQVTAEIAVEHGELGRMLAAELPSLQSKLAEHHIPPASLVLQTQTSGSFADSGQRSGNWQRMPQAQSGFSSYAGDHAESRSITTPELTGSSPGLDIHM